MPSINDTGGSAQSLTLNGITYDVPPDVDLDFVRAAYKNEAMAGLSRNIRKVTKQVQEMKSVVVFANINESEVLAAGAAPGADQTMAVKLADGSVYRSAGWYDYEGWSSQDLKAKLTLFPRQNWTPFASS